MCSSPDIKDPPPPPPPPQLAKAPDTNVARKKQKTIGQSGMGQSTSPVLLSGAGGVPNSSMSLGAVGSNMLLGGGSAAK